MTSESLLTPPAERLLLVVLLGVLMCVTGCASVSAATADPCVAFEPITTTGEEQVMLTEETMRQIDAHNGVWLELCE
ncbi:MAG: hypothetical protein ACO3P1_15225 [Pseudomonadales bacterium]